MRAVSRLRLVRRRLRLDLFVTRAGLLTGVWAGPRRPTHRGVVVVVTVRQATRSLAADGVAAVREVYSSDRPDVERVAALVEIAGAAAALARTVRRFRLVEPVELYSRVSRRADVLPVLGRGRWLPTMTFHVPAPVARRQVSSRPASARRVVGPSVEVPLPLFAADAGVAAVGGGR